VFNLTNIRFEDLFKNQKYGPAQNYFELFTLMSILKGFFDMNNKHIMAGLEVGTFRGGTIRFFREIIHPSGKMISVDLNDRGFIPEIEEMYSYDKRMNFVKGDSKAEETIEKVKEVLGEEELDFIFIDGNHTKEYFLADYENYSQFVKDGGLVIFHDIVAPQLNPVWNELKQGKKFIEFFGNENPCGIGVVLWEKQQESSLIEQ
jgi:cephalosporin hydroxylase